jgi:hypothetical protein
MCVNAKDASATAAASASASEADNGQAGRALEGVRATQRVPVFEVADAATDVGESMVVMMDFQRCPAEGKHSGQWVNNTTIMDILAQVERLPDAALCIFRPFETLF